MKVISLSAVRKVRAKDAARAQADANAVRFGRTKAQKAVDEATKAKAKDTLDAHQRED